MNGRSYIIDFYDSRHYQGPTPVRGFGVCLLGENGSQQFLINLERELVAGETPFSQILASTSYEGDPIERLLDSSCTVNIHIVTTATPLDENSHPEDGQSQFLCNGKISPTAK